MYRLQWISKLCHCKTASIETIRCYRHNTYQTTEGKINYIKKTCFIFLNFYKAFREVKTLEQQIIKQQELYNHKRAEQRERLSKPRKELSDEDFWKEESEHAPEIRAEMSKRSRRQRCKDEKENEAEQKPIKLFTGDGRPLNLNKPKVPFTLCYDDPKEIVFDIAVYK